jgi:carbon-monoxide dehydrogenase medium subunit
VRALAVAEPEKLEEAISLLEEHGDEAKLVAGSTAVTIMLRQGLIDPNVLVMLHRLRELRQIGTDGSSLRLEALVTHDEVERSDVVRRTVPVLTDVFATVGNVRVRSVATVGGVLAEADYASDPPCALVALDAAIEVAGPSGSRSIPVDEFFRGFYETALAPDEVVTAVRVPVPAEGTVGVYSKFTTRSSEDRPCVGVLALLRRDENGRCSHLAVAAGAASELPQRFRDVEQAAVGQAVDESLASQIADEYATRSDTLADVRGSAWYRKEMIRVWVRRSILRAAETSTQ